MKKVIENIDKEQLSEMGFWNDENVAFIKQANENGKIMWSIYAADGEKIAIEKFGTTLNIHMLIGQ